MLENFRTKKMVLRFSLLPKKRLLCLLSRRYNRKQDKQKKHLRESEERFRFVAEAANVLVYEFEVETGKVTLARGLKS